jgi:quinol monooxygenase YgiN
MRSFALLMAAATAALATKTGKVAVTEVANITLIANASTAVFDQAAKTIIRQKGAVTVRSSRLVENKDSFRLFIDWESLDASHRFAKDNSYKDMMKDIRAVTTEEPVLYHIAFQPSPPVVFDNYEGKGKAPFTEFLNFFFPSGNAYNETREANVTETVQALLAETAPTAAGFTGLTALGWGVEEIPYMGAKHRVFAIGVGWETVEAHKTWMTTPAYAAFLPQLYALDGLAGIEMRHVSNKIVKKA